MTDNVTTDDGHDDDRFDFAEELGMVVSFAILDMEDALDRVTQPA